MWIGTVALAVFVGPVGLYAARHVSTSTERSLTARGRVLGETLARQVVNPMLLNGNLAMYSMLHKSASVDEEVRYLCIENASGEVVAHTFARGYPAALAKLWQERRGQVIPFRTKDGRLMDIPVPIMAGRLGTLHVGMSRRQATAAARRTAWVLGFGLAGALAAVLLGARLVAARVSLPLRRLEAEVSRFPKRAVDEEGLGASGTREVASLANRGIDLTQPPPMGCGLISE